MPSHELMARIRLDSMSRERWRIAGYIRHKAQDYQPQVGWTTQDVLLDLARKIEEQEYRHEPV